MKQMNGTVTLSFVEEDNKQRVIFRVVPLCTREGVTFRDAMDLFPDEASLRVVPDKREQSTFKERMRGMGSLCVIELAANDGKEIGKIRQNRNYDPAQGEKNQFAIYSDVILEFAPESVFEVLELKDGQLSLSPEQALTQTVLLLFNKVLYGPVDAQEAAAANPEALKPFGNDRFLLHAVEMPDHTVHTVYWNPDATINWRQRRGNLRRKGDRAQQAEDAAEAPQDVSVAVVDAEAREEKRPEEAMAAPPQETVREEAAPVLETAQEAALPIGTKLNILDTTVSFEQHISRLDQPVSEQANRLTVDASAQNKQLQELSGRFSGTPLVRDPVHAPRTVSRPEPLHYVVEQQMRISRDERASAELHGGRLARLENPVENLMSAVDAAWQDAETRAQAVEALIGNDGFLQTLLATLRGRGHELNAVTAAYAQLKDIEAERLSLLMQLDLAQNAEKQYQEQALASVSQKKREEIAGLTRQVDALRQEKAALEDALQTLGLESQSALQEKLAQQLVCFGGVGEKRVLLAPVVGKHRDAQEMTETLHRHMNAKGFAMDKDDVLSLLIACSISSAVCFRGHTLADAKLYAATMLEALGLRDVSAMVGPGVNVEIASLLPEDEHRTPTVTLQVYGTDALPFYGHRTIFLADAGMEISLAGPLAASCVVQVPPLGSPTKPEEEADASFVPAALSSFSALRDESHALMEEGERWFNELKSNAMLSEYTIPECALLSMHQFVEIAARKLRGGFLGAADTAMRQWIVPKLPLRSVDPEKLQVLLASLPRSMEAMGFY